MGTGSILSVGKSGWSTKFTIQLSLFPVPLPQIRFIQIHSVVLEMKHTNRTCTSCKKHNLNLIHKYNLTIGITVMSYPLNHESTFFGVLERSKEGDFPVEPE
jgi:hypothetical protein